MRQTFPFASSRHKPAQALAQLKNKIRKYIKRERRKELPEGVDYWDFDCRIGPDEASAVPAHVAELIGRFDVIAESGATQVYLEILSKPGHRTKREVAAPSEGGTEP